MSAVMEVDSMRAEDEREAELSSRLASLNIPDSSLAWQSESSAPEPYALSSTMQAALQVAESRRLEENLRAKEAELAAHSGGHGSSNTGALTAQTIDLSSRLRDREEVAETLRQRERSLEVKLKEKRATEAALMRRVDQLQSRLLEVEGQLGQSQEEARNLQDKLTADASLREEAQIAEKAAMTQVRKLEFQTRQQDEQIKALANRVKQESMDKASRWKEYAVVEKGMQKRLREKEGEEFRLLEKVRALETKLEMNHVKLSEMVAREQSLLAQVEDYRAAEQRMSDGVMASEQRSKALASSLVEKEATEGELLEKLRQMEMRNGTLQLLLERAEKLQATVRDEESRLRSELEHKTASEAEAQRKIGVLDTERRLRSRELTDLNKQIAQLEEMNADHEEVAASLRARNDSLEAELSTERSRMVSLQERIAAIEAAAASKDEEIDTLKRTLANEKNRSNQAETALVKSERSQVTVAEKERKLIDEVKDSQMQAMAANKRNTALIAQISELKKNESELAEGLNTLGVALNAKDDTIAHLERELRTIRKYHAEAAEALTMKAAVVAELNTKLGSSVSRHKTLQALLWRQEKVEATMKERESLLEEQLKESRATAATLTQNVRELTARLREVQEHEARLDDRSQADDQKLQQQAKQLETAKGKLEALTKKVDSLQHQNVLLEERVAQLDASSVEQKAALRVAQDQVELWQDRSVEAEQRAAALEAEAMELEERLKRFNKDSNRAKATLWRQQQAETQLVTKTETQKQQLADVKQRCVELSAQTESLTLALHKQEEHARHEIAVVQSQLDRAQATNQELLSAIQQRERTEAVLSSQIEELNGQIRQHEAQEGVLQHRAENLAASLADKEKSAAALLANSNKLDKELTDVLRQRAALQSQLDRSSSEHAEAMLRLQALEEKHEAVAAELKAKIQKEAILTERHKHISTKLAATQASEENLKRRVDNLSSPKPSLRTLGTARRAISAFTGALEDRKDGAGSGAAPSTPAAASRREPGSPSTGAAAPRVGGLFHLAYSHPSRQSQRFAVYRSIFDDVDRDHSGSISIAELKDYIEATATRSGYHAAQRHASATPRGGKQSGSPKPPASSEDSGSTALAAGGGLGTAMVVRSKSAKRVQVDAHTKSRFCRFFTEGRGTLDDTFSKYDTDGNGVISWEEFKVLADEVFLPKGLGQALDNVDKRAATAAAKQQRAAGPDAKRKLIEWRLAEKSRQQRVLADEIDRKNKELMLAARQGTLGTAATGTSTPLKGVGGRRPPNVKQGGTPAAKSGMPRMQLLGDAESASQALQSVGTPTRPSAVSSGAPVASPAGFGVGEFADVKGVPLTPPRFDPESGTLTIPGSAGAPLTISPASSALKAGASAIASPAAPLQLPAWVVSSLKPEARQFVNVAATTPDRPSLVSAASPASAAPVSPTASVESDTDHTTLMAKLDEREKALEAELGEMEDSFQALYERDERLQEQLKGKSAANTPSKPADA